MHAACDFCVDAHSGAVVDEPWTAAAKADGIGQVRVALGTDALGRVPWNLFAQGLAAWHDAGVATDVLAGAETLPPFDGHWANQALGTGTHRLTSPYIERFRLQLEQHTPQLLAAGAGGVIAWNEPNGALVVQGARPTNAALAPEIYATLVWQTCHSLAHIGCERRIAGALSVLPQTGLDAQNPYLLGYLTAMYAHLASCGVRPNWTHLALNCEGYWTAESAQQMHDAIRACMNAHDDSAELIVTEWGVRNEGLDASRLLATGIALEAVFGYASFFGRPGQTPYLGPVAAYTGYGARQWAGVGTAFRVGAWYPAGDVVRQLWAT